MTAMLRSNDNKVSNDCTLMSHCENTDNTDITNINHQDSLLGQPQEKPAHMLEMMAADQRPHSFTTMMLQEKQRTKTTEDFEPAIFSTQQVYHIMLATASSSSMTRTFMQLGDTTPVALHNKALVKTLRAPYLVRLVPTGQWGPYPMPGHGYVPLMGQPTPYSTLQKVEGLR